MYLYVIHITKCHRVRLRHFLDDSEGINRKFRKFRSRERDSLRTLPEQKRFQINFARVDCTYVARSRQSAKIRYESPRSRPVCYLSKLKPRQEFPTFFTILQNFTKINGNPVTESCPQEEESDSKSDFHEGSREKVRKEEIEKRGRRTMRPVVGASCQASH